VQGWREPESVASSSGVWTVYFQTPATVEEALSIGTETVTTRVDLSRRAVVLVEGD
jgi:hypothetical protein